MLPPPSQGNRDFPRQDTGDLDGGGNSAVGRVSPPQLAAVIRSPCVGAAEGPLQDEVVAITAVEIGDEMIHGRAVAKVDTLTVDKVRESA